MIDGPIELLLSNFLMNEETFARFEGIDQQSAPIWSSMTVGVKLKKDWEVHDKRMSATLSFHLFCSGGLQEREDYECGGIKENNRGIISHLTVNAFIISIFTLQKRVHIFILFF